jgi:pimeloyl-[acyl-carrier protein] methyl ester esterase
VSALHCEVSGRGPRDLVLLHGWGLNLRVWDGLVRALSPGFRLIAVDLPGHGRSDWDMRAATRAAQAWRVHETLAPLTQRYTLIGWSLGGQYALDLAAALPAGIERIVLIATTPKFVAGADWRCGAPPSMLWRLVTRLHSDCERTMSEFFALQVRGCAPQTAARALASLHRAIAREGCAQPRALMNGLVRLGDGDLRPALAQVQVPALVVAGSLDRITRPAASRALAAALPEGRYVEFSRAAHVPFLTHARRFLRVLTEFLHGRTG